MIDSVANILERRLQAVIQDWCCRVDRESGLMCIPLSCEERGGHLPKLLNGVIVRLREDAAAKGSISDAASVHGDLRRKQGYTVAMIVEESRLLQVSIFTMLHKNLVQLDLSCLLPDVATIADEVDAQLKQHMVGYMGEELAPAVTPRC